MSFYEQMMKKQEKEEQEEKNKQRLEQEAIKLREEEETRQIKEELMRREEDKIKRKKLAFINSMKDKDSCSSNEDLHSAGVTNNNTAASKGMQRTRSASSVCEPYTGSRVIEFNTKTTRYVVHCGKCLGQGSSGSAVYSGIDLTSGDLVVVAEWKFTVPRSKKLDPAGDQDAVAKLIKQVASIEQETSSLVVRVHHKNLVHYIAVEVKETKHGADLQILMEYCGGGDLTKQLRPGGLPLDEIRHYTHDLVDVLCYLHYKSVVHKDIKELSSLFVDSERELRLADYSVGKRLSDLHQVFGEDKTKKKVTFEENKKSTKYGKTVDIHFLGLLVLSLAQGDDINQAPKDLPVTLPKELQDFLSKCLILDEKERWTAQQLSQHPFICPTVQKPLPYGEDTDKSQGKEEVFVEGTTYPEPLPDAGGFYTSFSCRSRLKNEFEVLEWLGKGGFGDVIKVQNRLDGNLYAIKRVLLNPRSTQFNRKITREVKLLSRLNHEHVVRYYNSWIEIGEEESGDSAQGTQEEHKPILKNTEEVVENSLMKLDNIEPPSVRDDGTTDDSWCSDGNDNNESDDSSSTSSMNSVPSSPRSKLSNSLVLFSKSDSSEGIVFTSNMEESVLQFGGLLDSDEDESEEEQETVETTDSSREEKTGMQFLYIQMEYCEKSTLRNLIDDGLYQSEERVWSLFREIVEGLLHVHSQGMIHRDLKPVNIFLDSKGHVKIGDFGLATTHTMARGNTTPLPENLEASVSEKMVSSDVSQAEGMTGRVGTALYVSPELGTTDGRTKYSQKVDMYSLGIIFFEMCFPPLKTTMERVNILGNLRREEIVFPDGFNFTELPTQGQIITKLLQHDPENRPDSQELLKHYIPPNIEDDHLDEVLRHTLSSTNTSRYLRLVTTLLSQDASSVLDFTYDIHLFPGGVGYKTVIAQQHVFEVLQKIFKRHGAVEINTPSLLPKCSAYGRFPLAVNVMDHSGLVVNLPYDMRIPFARYIVRNNVSQLKRYSIGKVYRKEKILQAHPKELLECAFDIVTGNSADFVPDAEVLFTVSEIINEFPTLSSQNFYIQVNHTELIASILTSLGVAKDKVNDVFVVMQETKNEKLKKESLQNFLRSLSIPDQAISSLTHYLDLEGPIAKIKEDLNYILRRKNEHSFAAKQAIRELNNISKFVEKFGCTLPIVIKTGLVYNIQHFSGIIFQIVTENKRRMKYGGVEVFAMGGRYDRLISHFRRGSESLIGSGAVGVSLAVERIISAVLEDVSEGLSDSLPPSSCDVLICSVGSSSNADEEIKLAKDLWNSGLKANILYESRQYSLEELQNYSKECGIMHMVLLKEQDKTGDTAGIRVRSVENDRYSETKVAPSELMEYLAKVTADTYETNLANTKIPLTQNQSSSESQSSSNVSPISTVFVSQDKIPGNIKRRYEGQMLSKVTPIVQHIMAKGDVHVVAVELPGQILNMISEHLQLECDEETYEASLQKVSDKQTLKFRKYVIRVCDEIHKIKGPQGKKTPLVFLYSYKDESCVAIFRDAVNLSSKQPYNAIV